MSTDDAGPKLKLNQEEWTRWREQRVTGASLLVFAKKTSEQLETKFISSPYQMADGPASILASAIITRWGTQPQTSEKHDIISPSRAPKQDEEAAALRELGAAIVLLKKSMTESSPLTDRSEGDSGALATFEGKGWEEWEEWGGWEGRERWDGWAGRERWDGWEGRGEDTVVQKSRVLGGSGCKSHRDSSYNPNRIDLQGKPSRYQYDLSLKLKND